jgi:hypothetical protein
VPIADSALLSIKLLKRGTLRVYKGLGHGLCTINPDALLDTGDDGPFAATMRTGLNVDPEHALKTLRPAPGCQWGAAVHAAVRVVGHDAIPEGSDPR